MNSVIKTRIELVLANTGKNIKELPDVNARSFIENLRQKFFITKGRITKQTINVSDLSSYEIRKYIHDLPINKEEEIFLLWLSYDSGAVLSLSLFIENYDEFWYPSSDDIFITDKNFIWLLEIDHEENIAFYKEDPI